MDEHFKDLFLIACNCFAQIRPHRQLNTKNSKPLSLTIQSVAWFLYVSNYHRMHNKWIPTFFHTWIRILLV